MTILAPCRHHPHIPYFSHLSANSAQPLWPPLGIPTILKGWTMNARFLRDEAARFRGMAVDADREATRVRFLAMAADYEARAGIANESGEPNSGEANSELVDPTQDEAPKITLGRKIATGLKETVLVQRRPVGHPRRE
jgi:hypothetical protein